MLVFTDLGQRAIDLRKAKSKEQIMCVSAVVFKPTKYTQFSRVWNKLFNRWGASAFHATDFYGGADEFRRNSPERASLHTEDSKRIPELIGSNVEKVTLIAFRPSEYLTEAPAGWLRGAHPKSFVRLLHGKRRQRRREST
jgi:hypothetical protein